MPFYDHRDVLAVGRQWATAETLLEVESALAAALGRHEIALARLRRSLPWPSAAEVRELEAAEQELRAVQARRDTLRR